MPVTIKDVAKMAGVSPSTVSRVLANSSKISDATKERVSATMKEMNYQPNIIARSLANKVTYTLGLILPSQDGAVFENPFFMQAMRGLSLYAQSKGYYIMYNYCQSEAEEITTVDRYINSKWVDGIILTTMRINDQCVARMIDRQHPFVVIGQPETLVDKLLWVDNDNVKIMEEVVTSLIKQGHKKIAFIGGGHDFLVNKHRLKGYKLALEHNKLLFDEALVIEDNYVERDAFDSMKELLGIITVDAIVGTDDIVASGAMKAMHEAGYMDVAVAGFNDTPLSILNEPPMSSVSINAEELGKQAAKLLIDYVEKKEVLTNYHIIEAKYMERATTLNHKRPMDR